MDTGNASVKPGDIFVRREANGDGDGPMRTSAEFWEVTALTAKRAWASKLDTWTIKEIPDPDGTFRGGRSIVPLPGNHIAGTKSLVRIVNDDTHGIALQLPRRHYIWISTARLWDGQPRFVHPN